MKLDGLVEDIHLDEVLRVLAVAGRSGALHVKGEEDQGHVTLREGRLVAARVDSDTRTVADVLKAADVLTDDVLDSLTEARRKEPIPDCFGDVMVVAPELAEDAARVLTDRLRELVQRLLAVGRGTFSFQAAAEAAEVPCYLGDQGVAVAGGIEAEAVVARARDERAARPAPARGKGTRTRLPAVEAPTEDLLVVDDDPALLEAVCRRIVERGLKVGKAGSAREAWERVSARTGSGRTAAVVDLVMPRVDGRGILGGLDLVRRLKEKEPGARVILTSEADNTDAVDRARELGVSLFVRKPPPERMTPQDTVAFVDAVLAAAGLSDRAGSVDLGSELMAELGEAAPIPVAPLTGPQAELARALEMLRDMVGPVNDPERRDEIPLMILRVASTTFSRAALFLVTEGDFVGLGGFGLDANNRDPGKALRDTHIPLEADTVLAAALKEGRPGAHPFFASEWNRYLSERLGGPLPSRAWVAPILCSHRVEAVLYCDNAPDGRELGDTQVLELFLTQAGAAMERAILEQQLLGRLGGAV
ncbi:MAG: response regulator [Deltaproteobacteria bacterium]|nr:response regulator [Deltaproteobacteria bacterium]